MMDAMARCASIPPASGSRGSGFRSARVFALGLALCVGLGCRAEERPSGELAADSVAFGVPPGDLRDWSFAASFAVYLLKEAPADLPARAREHAQRMIPYATPVEQIAPDPDAPVVRIEQRSIAEYPAPDQEDLVFFGIGVSKEQGAQLQRSPAVLVLSFASPMAEGDRLHRDALRLVHGLASELGGLAWDSETRQVFSPEAWKAQRIATLSEVLDVEDHVAMRAYGDGEMTRVVTLGMRKLGLPDVVASGVAAPNSRSMGSLINLVCQTLHESARISDASLIRVDAARLDNAKARESQRKRLRTDASGRAALRMRFVQPEQGDADNRMIELVFSGTGASAQERQAQILEQIYGTKDGLLQADHGDAELKQARERALAEFRKLEARIRAPRVPGERFQVKAPFETPDGGHEWMWVEVQRWEGDTLVGILDNEPFAISGLRAGARVEVEVDSIFDYIHYLPSGERVGNETQAIIERQSGTSEP